jgi:predicted RNase H-like HicB family nuclease
MEYQVVLEYDEESRHYTGTVPGLPIVVDAKSKRETLKLAREAIAIFREESQVPASPNVRAELVRVKV